MTNLTQCRSRILGIHRRVAGTVLALATVLVSTVVATGSAQARTYSVRYSFTGGMDGANPTGGLLRDAQGNLYGTTPAGGSTGYGTVFKVNTTGRESVLYSFTGSGDGAYPTGSLVRDGQGTLYGTTSGGGAYGAGTVFKVDKRGKETVLYSFTGTGGDGANPQAGLVRDAQGNLYSTTWQGGASGVGTVFKVDKTGTETVLYSFKYIGGDGGYPTAGVVRDAQGNLYGTTGRGGDLKCNNGFGCGTVYRVDPTGQETVLHIFTGIGDGIVPYAGLVRDAQGNLYGATSQGGSFGYGTVFKLSEAGQETVLHSFGGTGGDGSYPYVSLVRDTQGNLYGTTAEGGRAYFGTVFKVDKKGKETVIHSFAGPRRDGSDSQGSLVRDGQGILYGTTYYGGAYGYGTVFKLTP